MNDHDLLIAVSTKISVIENKIDEMIEQNKADHQTVDKRLRHLETWLYRSYGAIATVVFIYELFIRK